MSDQPEVSSRLLVVEDDLDTRELLGAFLRDEGYDVTLADSPAGALEWLEQHAFHLVVTDLFASEAREPLRSVEKLRQFAEPTPVGVVTSWPVSAEEALRQGFAFLLAKPFDLEELLTTIAGSLHLAFNAEQQRQAAVARRFIEVLSSGNLDALAEVCTLDVRYYPPTSSPYAPVRRISGLASYREYIRAAYSYFREFRFGEVLLFVRPKGLAARYQGQWVAPDGQTRRALASMLFHFRGEMISQIGVRLNQKRFTRPPKHGKR